MISPELIDRLRVPPGEKVRLKDYPTGWEQSEELKALGKDVVKERAAEELEEGRARLAKAQELLYADGRQAILIVLQAMDAAGKDSTIKHVMSGVNPQGCQVHSFKAPSEEELRQTFLWRAMLRLPAQGMIGVFNRSYYEEVLVVKVHPELLEAERLPPGKRGKKFWEGRYDDINAFEHHLTRSGTTVVKFFLHVSKDEQKRPASWSGWTVPRNTGSSPPPTSPSAPAGTTTWPPSSRLSPPRARSAPPGTSFPRTTSGPPAPSSPTS